MKNKKEKSQFDLFQLEEYKNISNSHFESGKQVSTFFRYYLLLLSAPAILLTLISSIDGSLNNFFQGNLEEYIYNLVFAYILLIALSGFCIYFYILNIRHDSILYARTVNKVRKYFYDNSNMNIDQWSRYLELPTSGSKPKYFEKIIFLPLAIIFTLINSSFLFFAFYLRKLKSEIVFDYNFFGSFTISDSIYWFTFSFVLIHLFLWFGLSYLRENMYLKSYSFGVDIDGVINNQTDNFIKWYKKIYGVEIKRKQLKEIPVRLNESLNISSEHEEVIFNCKEYWEDLSENENAFKTIKEIHKSFGYKVFLYTHRDWGTATDSIKEKIQENNYTVLDKATMLSLTKGWLVENGLDIVTIHNFWDVLREFFIPKFLKLKIRLTIEKGNSYISDSRRFFIYRNYKLLLNRFQGVKRNDIRFFVEDRPENAIKLASITDFVFLYDQPYNQTKSKTPKYRYPKNVIRVRSWNEIYRHIKELS